MASIWPIIILQFACQRRAPYGKLINQLWSIAYHVLFMQSIRPGPEITEPIRSEATRSESIRSEFYSIRYGVVLCLASVTCTSVIKRRLILIIFLKNLPSSCLLLHFVCARLGSVQFGSVHQVLKAIKRPVHEFGSFTSRVHFSSPLPWV